tara:strand:- start:114 stop:500 length:387 start_codon:yes stop_codon:yes gene_type:complete
LAKLTLIVEVPNGAYLLKGYGQDSDKLIKTDETVECLASRAIQFIGCSDFTVELNNDELKEIDNKTLEPLVELGQFSSVDSLREHYAPVKQSMVSKVLSKTTVKTEELPVKETLEETSDKAVLADTSE